MTLRPACFISFEGGDGAGKSTQVKMLAAALRDEGVAVVTTREPGGAPQAEVIRDMLVSGATDKWDPVSEILLLYAARREHCRHTIWPALEAGSWVISDRFADSTMAYQGYGHGMGRSVVEKIHEATLQNFAPNLTFILDIAPDAGLQRADNRNAGKSRFEQMDMGFHQALRDGFLDIARREPNRCVVIDATASAEEIHKTILKMVVERLLISAPRSAQA